jgi:hypothetical protein
MTSMTTRVFPRSMRSLPLGMAGVAAMLADLHVGP